MRLVFLMDLNIIIKDFVKSTMNDINHTPSLVGKPVFISLRGNHPLIDRVYDSFREAGANVYRSGTDRFPISGQQYELEVDRCLPIPEER